MASQVNISEPFIRRPVATSLLMAAVALVGVAAFLRLPVAPLPQVDFPTIQVTATLAGASAETMASSVATPLERQLGQIPGVTEMTSFSALGATSVTVQFDLNRNIDLAAQDVQAAITAAGKTLPQTMTTPPTYKKLNPADAPILVLAARSDTLPLTQVDEYADSYLAQQISQVPGVAQVAIGGEQRPSIRVQVDPAKLAARGLTLEQVRGALVTATTDAPKGSLTTAKTSFTIDANDQITDAKQFDDVIISYNNGAPVRVRDVGRAIAAATDRFSAAYEDNTPAILLSVYKQPGANVIDTVERIKTLLPKITAAIPPAVKVDTVLDRTTTIRASVLDVEFTLILTVVLVVLVVLLFLRDTWATLVPAFTIALSLSRRVCGDVCVRLQPGQSVAHGAHDRHRLCCRRCDRRSRKRLPPYRARYAAIPSRSGRIGGNTLHGAVHQRVADRGLHPAVADGRNCWPLVSRICRDSDGRGRSIRIRVAVAGAHAVRAFSAAQSVRRTRQAISRH